MTCPRLIEIALPIREISAESVRDKSLRHGHISTLHLWWARRPLAASRAIVFASLVPDPDHPECPSAFRKAVLRLLKDDVPKGLRFYYLGRQKRTDADPYRPYTGIADTPRNRLLAFIAKWSREQKAFDEGRPLDDGGVLKQPSPGGMLDDRCLVKWETSDPANEQGQEVLRIARELIRIAHAETLGVSKNPKGLDMPVVLDPFAGGGAIPLEATRLGAQAIANDYNPVAYLILRATCEFPQKYGKPGTRTVEREEYGRVTREQVAVDNVLAYDVKYWAKWILERARKQIGHFYPPGKDGKPVVGYLWARTAPCSNPTCRAEIPLLRTLLVCNKSGKRVALTMTRKGKEVTFGIAKNRAIKETDGTMIEKGRGNVRCPICQQTTPVADLRRAGLDGKLGERMVAVITDTAQGKEYRPVETVDLEAFKKAARLAEHVERPGECIVPEINGPNAPADAGAHRSISVDIYGYKTFGSLFGYRQLLAMQTFVARTREALAEIAKNRGQDDYDKVVGTYLGLWISRNSMRMNSMTRWDVGGEKFQTPFDAQAIPMRWDYCEANPFSDVTGGFSNQQEWIIHFVRRESRTDFEPVQARVLRGDGAHLELGEKFADIVVTDPPYFDAIAYADLSDFFYIWLKRVLGDLLPDAFAMPQTPKSEEAVAHKHRHHGDRQKGEEHFRQKLAACFSEAKRVCKPDAVLAVMFAHQSTEAWSALISALFSAGLTITATYPIDTELKNRSVALGVSALESSITVICRAREVGTAGSFRDVRREIDAVVAESVHRFFGYGFRGADLIVACYGPAVGVFGRHERVERADGTPVEVPELLALVRESALKAIAGEFEGDNLTRLYFVWTNLYGIGEQAWDDARMVVQIGGEAENAMEVARHRGLFVVDGSSVRLALLADRANHKHLGDELDAPLIDQLHHAMRLWQSEKGTALVTYLWQHELLDSDPFWKLAQALFEVLPRETDDWKLVSILLGEREGFKSQAKEQQKQGKLL